MFRGSFTSSAAEQVAGASLADLAALVEKSLIQLWYLSSRTLKYCANLSDKRTAIDYEDRQRKQHQIEDDFLVLVAPQVYDCPAHHDER